MADTWKQHFPLSTFQALIPVHFPYCSFVFPLCLVFLQENDLPSRCMRHDLPLILGERVYISLTFLGLLSF